MKQNEYMVSDISYLFISCHWYRLWIIIRVLVLWVGLKVTINNKSCKHFILHWIHNVLQSQNMSFSFLSM